MADLNRRQLLRLAVASLAVLAGCATARRHSSLDGYHEELRQLLEGFARGPGNETDLASIARRIEMRSAELVAEQQEFYDTLDRQLKAREVTQETLEQTIEGYSSRRALLRNDLLALQDELHEALGAEEWRQALEVLNRMGLRVVDSPIGTT